MRTLHLYAIRNLQRCTLALAIALCVSTSALAPADSPTTAASQSVSAPAGFTGLWTTTYGAMRLNVIGDDVHGTYAWNGVAEITGKRDGDRAFSFSYSQPDGERGTGRFELAADGDSFAGTWKTASGGGGNWSGARNRPVPGRVWLIVLEENWESSLAAPEYSYGQMLRSFFTRVPHVEVRHRFVHSIADVRRWSSEAAYFAEPVVLYISSHGAPSGAIVGSDVVGAKELIDCTKHIDDLRLLHFGACEMMSGDIPQQIAAARAPGQARFPISGFTRPADWAGSAIVDFTYLELVLARGMPPAEAAEQTRKLIKFADEDAGTAIPGSGLKLYVPMSNPSASQPAEHDE